MPSKIEALRVDFEMKSAAAIRARASMASLKTLLAASAIKVEAARAKNPPAMHSGSTDEWWAPATEADAAEQIDAARLMGRHRAAEMAFSDAEVAARKAHRAAMDAARAMGIEEWRAEQLPPEAGED